MKYLVGIGTLLALALPANAGVFIRANVPPDEPFIIVHPWVYSGTGGDLNLSICVTASTLAGPVLQAISIWNELQPMVGNCPSCEVIGPNPPPAGPHHLPSLITHELGHCALGLG